MKEALLPLSLFGLIFLGACSTSEDSSAPHVESISQESISIFDTLEVKFSEALKALDSSHIDADPEVDFIKSNSKTLKIFGASNYLDLEDTSKDSLIFTTFKPDTTYRIIFSDFQDESGNERESDSIVFDTHPFPDSKDNDEVTSADTIGTNGEFINGVEYSTGQTFTGILEGLAKLNTDNIDQYAITLTSKSTVNIKLSKYSEKMKLIFKGPIKPGQPVEEQVFPFWVEPTDGLPANLNIIESDKAGEDLELSIAIDANRQSIGLADDQPIGTPLVYWVEIKWLENPNDGEFKISPYEFFIQVEK